MDKTIKESHALREAVNSVPKDDSKIEVYLWKGTFSIKYDWRDSLYTIRGGGRILEINEGRLSAFGVNLKNFKLSDTVCVNLINYIAHYESFFRGCPPGVRREY